MRNSKLPRVDALMDKRSGLKGFNSLTELLLSHGGAPKGKLQKQGEMGCE
jgi:hypothetical protein